MARCWLMKSEPEVYSIDDLKRDGSTCWEGVRNYQARNLMREMEVGDPVLFYHSNAKPPGVAGLARVSRSAYPDHFSWEEGHKYFDPKSAPETPRWWMVDVEYVDTLPTSCRSTRLKSAAGDLENMVVTKRSRLSVQPVQPDEYDIVRQLGGLG